VFSDLSPAEKTEEKGKLGQNNEIFCEVLRFVIIVMAKQKE